MARRPAATDGLLALVLGVEMQVELLFADAPTQDLWIARGVLLVLALGLAVRRRAPVLGAVIGVGVAMGLERLDPSVTEHAVGPFFGMLILSFSVGAFTHGRRLVAGVAVLVVGSSVSIRLQEPPGGAGDLLFAMTIIVGGPVLLGRLMQSRASLSQALQAKAAAAEEERDARAAGAVADERARIAGDLHQLVNGA